VSERYPPEPWHLAGAGQITTWRVPEASLPGLPDGVRPVAVRGQAVVVTAFVDYRDEPPHGGQMAYHELLAAVVVRHGRGVALSITDIWVDDETSLAGGRGLWGIPKDLARFEVSTSAGSATDDAGPIAFATFLPRGLPAVPLPRLPSTVVQTLDGRTVASPIRAGGPVRAARSDWTFPGSGPLGWMRAGRPLASVLAPRFAMSFGSVSAAAG